MKYLVPLLTLVVSGLALHACACGQSSPAMLAGLCLVGLFALMGTIATHKEG